MTVVRRRPQLWGFRAQGSVGGMSDHTLLAGFLRGATPQGNPHLTPEERRGIAARMDSQALGKDLDGMWKVGGAKP